MAALVVVMGEEELAMAGGVERATKEKEMPVVAQQAGWATTGVVELSAMGVKATAVAV